MIRMIVLGLATVRWPSSRQVAQPCRTGSQTPPGRLKKAAEMCKAETALGHLAAERATDKRLKQFGNS